MPDDTPQPGSSGSHWGTRDPAGEPARPEAAGIGRLIMEARGRLGPDAVPEDIVEELRAAGVEVTETKVRELWDKT